MIFPSPRGDISQALFDYVHAGPGNSQDLRVHIGSPELALSDEDLQIALWSLYEFHYRSFDDIDDRLEWDPDLLAVRANLEAVFDRALREAVWQEVASQGEE